MNSGIYGIRNMKNGKWYIGGTTDLKGRKRAHFTDLQRGNHVNRYLQIDYFKDGIFNFEFIILEYVPENMLGEREQAWIKIHKANYPEFGHNISRGGGMRNKEYRIAQLERKKMSRAFELRRRTIIMKHKLFLKKCHSDFAYSQK